MKKSVISTAIALTLGLGAATAQAVVVTLVNNDTPLGTFPAADSLNDGAFSAGNEFRVMNAGAVSGGGEKSIIDGNQQWSFSDTTSELTSVSGTDIAPEAAANAKLISLGLTDVRAAAPGLFLNAAFLFPAPTGNFGYVAPLAGSQLYNDFGAATISFDSTDNFSMFFPVMEAHWANGSFTIGHEGGVGVTFDCTGATGGVGHCTAERQIDPADDSLGFANQYTQWEFDVRVDPPHDDTPPPAIPVPAAVWLFGSGLIGLVGVARRRKTS